MPSGPSGHYRVADVKNHLLEEGVMVRPPISDKRFSDEQELTPAAPVAVAAG